jgi:hypothetical protein
VPLATPSCCQNAWQRAACRRIANQWKLSGSCDWPPDVITLYCATDAIGDGITIAPNSHATTYMPRNVEHLDSDNSR